MAAEDDDEFARGDWARLRALRSLFLAAENGLQPGNYWSSARDFELYDATFAQRIGWKWDAVLRELELRRALPGGASIVDWGCGTGIAARKFLASGAGAVVERVHFVDRSKQACWFARDALKRERAKVETILHAPNGDEPVDVVLASHVLDELSEEERAELLALVRRSRALIWVESGGRATSRKLSELRDELLAEFDVLAPCTHREACGALRSDTQWCHLFARAPAEAFTSAFWRKFADELGLDLRSLPYSFLALRRKEASAPQVPDGGARVLGRPRVLKGRALLDACDASGVHELSFPQRIDKTLFKRLERSAGEVLVLDLDCDGRKISAARARWPSA